VKLQRREAAEFGEGEGVGEVPGFGEVPGTGELMGKTARVEQMLSL